MKRVLSTALGLATLAACASKTPPTETAAGALTGVEALEAENPVKPLPTLPLGLSQTFEELPEPPKPETVRLGRWLFYDKRLSKDGTVACATCHRPENAFSEPTPVSTGIAGQKGGRKAPSFTNQAWTIYPNFFWDGRADSLEAQAVGPIANPIEMGHTHEAVVAALQQTSYTKYFQQAFGSPEITIQKVAKAIADYERTRVSGNSVADKMADGDETAGNEQIKQGKALFFGKAECNQCHLGQNFTDSLFHNLGIGWDESKKAFKDEGRSAISKKKEDTGAFKTPGLRDITKHAPYMHDGSIATLKEVVQHYNKGGNKNPYLSPKIRPLNLTDAEVDAVVAFMQALDGEGYLDTAPTLFPQ